MEERLDQTEHKNTQPDTQERLDTTSFSEQTDASTAQEALNQTQRENQEQTAETITQTQDQISNLKQSVEVPMEVGKSFLNYLQQYPQTLAHIESYLTPPETIETWSTKIENIWGEFAFGSLDEGLQQTFLQKPHLLQSMKTGMSLCFSDWLNNLSQAQLQEVSQIGKNTPVLGSASQLFDVFKNLSSFKNQMGAITTILEGMDNFSVILTQPNQPYHIDTLPAFQSAEGFLKLLRKHSTQQAQPHQAMMIEDYFDISQELDVDTNGIMNNLEHSYGDKAHNLMKQVSILGPQVLEKKSALRETFGALYDQINEIVGVFTNGEPLSELIKGTRFEKPLNFIATLLGFGSIANYEKKKKIKEIMKHYPEQHQNGINEALKFMSQHQTEKAGATMEKLFGNISENNWKELGLKADEVTNQLPNEKRVKQSIERTLQTDESFFVHPDVLKATGLKPTANFYQLNQQKQYELNPATLDQYKNFIHENLDHICMSTWFQQGEQTQSDLLHLLQKGHGKTDLQTYLLARLTFPHHAVDIVRYNIITPPQSLSIAPSEEEDQKQNPDQNNEKTTNPDQNTDAEQTHKETTKQEQKQPSEQDKKESEILSTDTKTQEKIFSINIENSKSITTDEAIKTYGNTPAIKNFNPGNITDTAFGGQKAPGEKFTTFDTPQEGFKALKQKIENIQQGKSKMYDPNKSLLEYIKVYAPASDNNNPESYANNIANDLGIQTNTPLKDIDAGQLAVVHTKYEDHKSHQMLKDLGIIGTA